MKLKITKKDEEVTFRQKDITHTFVVNGKEVRVYEHSKQDTVFEDYDSDTEVDENDLKALTELEHEAFGEDLQEWLDLEVGDKTELEIEE